MFASSDKDNKYSSAELEENLHAAEKVKRLLGSLLIDSEIKVIEDFRRHDLEEALADEEIGHLMFFGHSKRSGVFVPEDPILWRNTDPLDHLKKSVGIIGCGVYDRTGVTPRFGFNLVEPNTGVIYGTPTGDIYPTQMSDLENFSILPKRLLVS
jgi:hypothetical protein